MKQELEDRLYIDHADLFQRKCGAECGDGWYSIIDELCALIEVHARYHSGMPDVVVTQIKEKFGGLRFYIQGGDGSVQKLIRAAEYEAYRTCEYCGSTEKVGRTIRGWVKTICRKCAVKNGKMAEWKLAEEE